LSFVKILQLIEKMELQLAAYQLPEKKSCPNKLFEICQIFENYRTSLLQEGIANSDDELLNEMVNEAR
jgi:maltooligosyltrehalose synthase